MDEVGIRVRLKERGRFSTEAKKIQSDIRGMGREAERADNQSDGLSEAFGSLGKVMGLLKPAGLIVGLGALIQVVAALAAGTVALVAGMWPMVGLFPALGVMAIGYATSLGVVKLAMSGVMDAVGGLNEEMNADALDKLTPKGQEFARTLNDMKPVIRDLQASAQEGLFPGLTEGLKGATPMLQGLKPIVHDTAAVIGQLAANAGRMFGGSAWVTGINKIGASNVVIIRNLGSGALHLATALMRVLVAAAPLAIWLSRMVKGWAEGANAASANAEQTGRLTEFFHKARIALTHIFSILGAVGSAFGGLMSAAYPVGRSLLALLDQNAAAMAKWVHSAEGQNKISAYFQQAKPLIVEVGRLIRDVVKAFFSLANGQGALPMVTAIRTELLPGFVTLTDTLTANLGPALTSMLSSFGELLTILSQSGGPLVLYASTLTAIASGMVWILTNVPGLRTMVAYLIMGYAAWKVLKIAILVAKGAHTAFLIAVGAGRTAMAAYVVVMQTWRAIAIANGAAATISSLGVLKMVAAARMATIGQWLLNAAMMAFPLFLIIGAFVAVGAGLYLLYTKVAWFRNAVNAVWSWIKANWPLLLAILTGPIGLAVRYIVQHWSQIKSGASSAVNWIKTAFNNLIDFFTGLPGRVGSVFSNIWSGVTRGFKGAINEVITAWNGLELSIGPIKIPMAPDIPKITVGTPNIPLLATGGVVTGTGSWITGEAGPELNTLMPNGGVKVQPLSGTDKSGPTNLDSGATPSSPGGMRLAVTIDHTTVLDGQPIARSVTRHAADAKARK